MTDDNRELSPEEIAEILGPLLPKLYSDAEHIIAEAYERNAQTSARTVQNT